MWKIYVPAKVSIFIEIQKNYLLQKKLAQKIALQEKKIPCRATIEFCGVAIII